MVNRQELYVGITDFHKITNCPVIEQTVKKVYESRRNTFKHFLTTKFVHPYHLDGSIHSFRDFRLIFSLLLYFT